MGGPGSRAGMDRERNELEARETDVGPRENIKRRNWEHFEQKLQSQQHEV